MKEFLSSLLTGSGFMPHGHCYLWTPGIVWLHVISDALIALAYYSIPCSLAWFVRQRRDIDFRWIFTCFAIFILACGTSHLLEIWNVWHSNYWLAGAVKAITAAASIPTAILLTRLLPQALHLPSPKALAQINRTLEEEVGMRRRAQEAQQQLNAELEHRVEERSLELKGANDHLRRQIAERSRVEAQLQIANTELQRQIAERDAADERARWLASFPEQNPNPIAEFETASGALRYANPAATALLPGLAAGGFDHPSLSPVRALLRGGQDVSSDILHCDLSLGGAFYALTVAGEARNSRVRLYASDITERKRAEEALRETQTRLHSALAAGSIGTWSWDLAQDRLVADEFTARVFSLSTEEAAQGRPSATYLRAVLEEDRAGVSAALARAVKACGQCDIEFRVRLGEDEIRWLQARGRVEGDAAAGAASFHGAVMDISGRREVEETIKKLNADLERRVIERTAQLEAANQELEAFSYSVSHDLRSPLRAVDGFSQALLEDYAERLPDEAQRFLQTIRGGAQQMGKLIDDLLTFSRLSRAALRKQEVPTGELVRGVLDDLLREHAGRSIELQVGHLPVSPGDPALLRQVWVNLLSNAFKYSRKRDAAVIAIGCVATPEGPAFFVRDNGTGFDMRYADKLFGVFQRLHRAEDFEGTGVGLAIVQRVIHRHGGRVWAEAAEDRGATFYFTIPAKG